MKTEYYYNVDGIHEPDELPSSLPGLGAHHSCLHETSERPSLPASTYQPGPIHRENQGESADVCMCTCT